MTHLNNIQQLCTNLEGDTELVVGEVYGMRQWSLRSTQDGSSLFGHNDFSWDTTGTQWSVCRELDVSEQVALNREFLEYELVRRVRQLFDQSPNSTVVWVSLEGSTVLMLLRREHVFNGFRVQLELPWSITSILYSASIDGMPNMNRRGLLRFTLEATSSVDTHDVTDPRCTCGFYAYTNPEALYENSRRKADSYFGIMKAWGYVSEGTRGFRAQKAQIVGLTSAMNKMTVLKYDQTIDMQKTELTEDGFKVTYEAVAVPSLQWVRSDTVPPAETELIPADFPRYDSMDEMFTAYRKITENAGR